MDVARLCGGGVELDCKHQGLCLEWIVRSLAGGCGVDAGGGGCYCVGWGSWVWGGGGFGLGEGVLWIREVKIPIPHLHITSSFVMLSPSDHLRGQHCFSLGMIKTSTIFLYVRRMRYACLHVIVS